MPREVAKIRRQHVEAYIENLLTRWKPATASNRYRHLFASLPTWSKRGEIAAPMARMTPPHVPEKPVPVLGDDELRRLLSACEGKGFEQRRDAAIIRLFIDSGLRLTELANLRVADLDLDQDVAVVMGKGRRQRACPFGNKLAKPSTATCGYAPAIPMQAYRGCG